MSNCRLDRCIYLRIFFGVSVFMQVTILDIISAGFVVQTHNITMIFSAENLVWTRPLLISWSQSKFKYINVGIKLDYKQ